LLDTIDEDVWPEDYIIKVARVWLATYNNKYHHLKVIDSINKKRAIEVLPGCLDSPEDIEVVYKSWMELQENPEFKQLSRYKFHSARRSAW
jgi:hypothetical protein